MSAPGSPPDPAPLSEEARKARSRRNVAIALALGAFVILVFVITIIKLSGGGVPHP